MGSPLRTTCERSSSSVADHTAPWINTGVGGESKYHAEVVLAARVLQDDAARRHVAELKRRLEEFSGHLIAVLDLPDVRLGSRVVGRRRRAGVVPEHRLPTGATVATDPARICPDSQSSALGRASCTCTRVADTRTRAAQERFNGVREKEDQSSRKSSALIKATPTTTAPYTLVVMRNSSFSTAFSKSSFVTRFSP